VWKANLRQVEESGSTADGADEQVQDAQNEMPTNVAGLM
jgi:hypothetical protein